jgi:glycosylphosphatidylinositol transamidase (GPIT) subunit GPI8
MLSLRLSIFLCCLIVTLASKGANWALLVAGSNQFINYRHQVSY